jgi:hypothetical protein
VVNVIEKSVCEIQNCISSHKSRASRSVKATKSYDENVLSLWNEFKQLFDTKKKLGNSSLSEMYCKIKGEIEDLGKGTIGTATLENFYKCKTNPKPNTLKLIASWVKNERRDYSEEDCENE